MSLSPSFACLSWFSLTCIAVQYLALEESLGVDYIVRDILYNQTLIHLDVVTVGTSGHTHTYFHYCLYFGGKLWLWRRSLVTWKSVAKHPVKKGWPDTSYQGARGSCPPVGPVLSRCAPRVAHDSGCVGGCRLRSWVAALVVPSACLAGWPLARGPWYSVFHFIHV